MNKSPFFRHYLANPNNHDSDGLVVVYADSQLFENMLHHLQHGVYPLFLSPTECPDVPKYLPCIKEARYLRLPGLVDWLEKGRCAEAYRIDMPTRFDAVGGWKRRKRTADSFPGG